MVGHARSHEEPKREIIRQLIRELLNLPVIHSLMGLEGQAPAGSKSGTFFRYRTQT